VRAGRHSSSEHQLDAKMSGGGGGGGSGGVRERTWTAEEKCLAVLR
jgi:mevalonate kinase